MAKTLVKYMGTADVKQILKGDKFGGRLKDGTTADMRWEASSGHVAEVDLDDEVLALLLAEETSDGKGGTTKAFVVVKDDAKTVPVSLNERIFRGVKSPVALSEVVEAPEQSTSDGRGETASDVPSGGDPIGAGGVAGGAAVGGSGTDTAGSTAGSGRGRTR